MKRTFSVRLLACLIAVGGGLPTALGWEIAIDATLAGVVDRGHLTLGAEPAGRLGYDALDVPHPPSLPANFVDLYTEHSQSDVGWEDQLLPKMRYISEFGPSLEGDDRSIDFVATTDSAGIVSLSWSPVSDPALENYTVILRDVVLGGAIDMKTQSGYEVFFFGAGERRFRVELTFIEPPTPTPTPSCQTDYDLVKDGRIDEKDVLMLATYMRTGGGGDLNCDDSVDHLDLWLLTLHWSNVPP